MTFFYDLNKKLDEIRATPELTHTQLNERDMSRAAKGYEKYGKEGMEALAKAGREGKALDPVRKKYDKYDNTEVDEGMGDMARKVGGMVKTVAGKALDTVGHGSDADMIRDLQKKMGMPQTGMKPTGAKPTGHPMDEAGMSEGGLPMVKGPDGKMLPKFAVDGSGPNDLKKSFADKIDSAKQEVDEMLGDVAAEAMKSAIGKMKMTDEGNDFTVARLAAIRAGKPTFKVGGKTYRVSGDTSDEKAMVEADKEDNSPFTAHKRPRVEQPKRGSVEQGSKHDIKHDTTDPKYSGRIATRRVDPNTGHSVGADDDTASGDKPKRKAGRPDGQGPGKRIGAKGPSGKSKLMTREGPDDLADQGEYDQEGDMAKDDIKTIVRHAQALSKVLGDNDNLPEWVQSKLAKIEGMMISIDEYMQNQEGDNSEEPIAEKAVSKKQQKFMGMVHAAQTGKKPASKEVAKVAKSMGKKDAEDFASTPHKGLPEKKKPESNKKEESVEENTVAGSVAPAMGGKAPKGKGGMTFGKGVYEGAIAESFRSKLNAILNEGMSVNMSADQDGKKSLTVTATDDDAVKLSQLLNLAGIGGQGQGYGAVCPGCGSSDCGCDHVEEDLANSAENTVYADTDYMVNGLSGGLDGQKTDQSTLGTVINQDPRRTIGSVAESNDVVELYKRIS